VVISSNAITLNLPTSDTSLNTSSNSGLEISSSGLALLRGCSSNQVLRWNSTTSLWECKSLAYVSSSGDTMTGALNLSSGLTFKIDGTDVLSGTTLGSGILSSSLTSVGALNVGSITSGFGSIDTGADNIITTGTMGSAGNTLFTGLSQTLSGTGNALTLSGVGANLAFTGAGLAQITTATSQNLSLMPGGNVGIGTTSPGAKLQVGTGATSNSSDSQVLIARVVDDTISGNGHAFSDSSDITRGGTIGYNSFDARIDIGGTANYDHYAAFQSAPTFGTGGTLSSYYGLYSGPAISSGILSSANGVYITDPTGAGAVTNNYGIRVEALAKGTNSNYAIYTSGTTPSLFGGNIQSSGSLTAGTNVIAGSTGLIGWSSRGGLTSSATGVYLWYNAAGTDFDRVAFGGTTNAFPALKRNGANLQIIAGDNSSNAGLFVTGSVGIGTTSPGAYKTYINGSLAVNSDTADKTGSTSWGTISDIRLKDIQGDYTLGLKEIMQLNAIKFNYKADNPLGIDSTNSYVGFAAQDVQKIIPEAISMRSDGYLRLNADPIMWAMLNAIKEQQGEIASQSAAIKAIPGLTFDSEKQTIIASNPIDFIKEAIFEGITTFKNAVNYLADVTFGGRVTFQDKDMAGYAKVNVGNSEVKVVFEKEYVNTPIVNITPLGQYDTKYWVADVTTKGFTIKISSTLAQEAQFNWSALSIKDAKTYESSGSVPSPTPITQSTTPTETVTPTVAPTNEPTNTPNPTPTIEPTIVPSLTPTLVASPSATP